MKSVRWLVLASLLLGVVSCGEEDDGVLDVADVGVVDVVAALPDAEAVEAPSELCPADGVEGIQGRTVSPSLDTKVVEVTVTLKLDGWEVVATTESDFDGVFRFDAVADGHYVVEATKSIFTGHVEVDVVGGMSTWVCVGVGV